MSKVTGLLPSPDKKGYTDIYADGEFIMTVSDDAVIESGIRTGCEFDADTVADVENAVTLTKAKRKAYEYLSYGDMSSKKLSEKLTRFGFDAAVAQDCVEAMKESGYIDDNRYAHALAKSLASVKLYGIHRIEGELRMKGVPETDIDDAIYSLDTDFVQSIKTLMTGKFRSKTDRQKLAAALLRYGHEWDDINLALLDFEEEYE